MKRRGYEKAVKEAIIHIARSLQSERRKSQKKNAMLVSLRRSPRFAKVSEEMPKENEMAKKSKYDNTDVVRRSERLRQKRST